MKAFFDTFGFLHVPGFASRQDCDAMLDEMRRIIDGWTPGETVSG
jgi:hypothetical protein